MPGFESAARKEGQVPMATMKFYMTPGSCTTGIHIILEELEQVFEAHVLNLPAGDHFRPEYVAINPKCTIPALVREDGSVLTEVPAIAYWLARANPRHKLWPIGLETETLALETMAYVAGTLHGQGFSRIFAAPTFSRNPDDHGAVQALGREIVVKGFAILDRQMEGRDYVAGAFSVADAILFYVEFWADKISLPLPPNLLAHYRLMLTRRAVRLVLREEGYNPEVLGRAELTT